MFEWISCNQFDRIKEISNAVYSTIWKFSPLNWNIKELIKKSNRIVALKVYLYNEVLKGLNKFRQYQIEDYYNDFEFFILKNFEIFYGKCIKCGKYYTNSEYNWCKPCQINWLKENFMNWTSENEQIDNLIQEIQLSINDYEDAISEWIPYYQFNDIERLDNIVYSAKWENGPLSYNYYNEEYARNSANKSVILKYLVNSQNITNEFLKKIMATYGEFKIYGISQNPKTKDYIIVFNKDQYLEDCCVNCGKYYTNAWNKRYKCCKHCQISCNYRDIIFEWIPYCQFNDIEELSSIAYLARWRDGPLSYSNYFYKNEYARNSANKPIILKYLVNSKNITNELLNEIIAYYDKVKIYGISQSPNTKDYIMIFNKDQYLENCCIKCGKYYTTSEYKWSIWKDGLLSYNNYYKNEYTRNLTNIAVVLKYLVNSQNITNEFLNEIMAYYDKAKIYAKWKDSLLYWNEKKHKDLNKAVILKYLINPLDIASEFLKIITYYNEIETYEKYTRNSANQAVILKYLINSENITNEFLNEIITYYDKVKIYEYKWCKPCQVGWLEENFTSWTSENKQIDDLIQELQLKIKSHRDIIFEWISYSQFDNIKELNNLVYSAKWNEGSLYWNKKKYVRNSVNKVVILEYLNNSQNITDKLLNEIVEYYDKFKIYGITQNPITQDYIIVLDENQYLKIFCDKCANRYVNMEYKWFNSQHITSKLLKEIMEYYDKLLTIYGITQNPNTKDYILILNQDQYSRIFCDKCARKYISAKYRWCNNTAYSARWKDGPLRWNEKKYVRNTADKTVALKYLFNSENITNEFLNEITSCYDEFEIYGITHNRNTKDYIIVFSYDQYFRYFCDKCSIKYIDAKYKWYIIFEWIPYDQFNEIKEIGKGGFAKVYSARWKDGPLCWNEKEYIRDFNKTVALKCLNNSQNFSNKFFNEVKAYSINDLNNINNSGEILKIYGISQNPNTKTYVMVLQYARGGNFNNWMKKNYKHFEWINKLKVLKNIINGLKEIHQKHMVHRDFHTGNILFKDTYYWITSNYISDMGLCGEVDNVDETKIYGVMPYVAPEVLRGGPYTKAADIFSFGMIMYFVATERQPFANCAHDEFLALDICNGTRPEINKPEAPKCYVDLMKKCWDLNPINRPNVAEVEKMISLFYSNYEDQFKEAEEYRLNNDGIYKNNQPDTHLQAIYTSRILNSFTKELPKYSECLECAIGINLYNQSE
ncbi:kinase-like domain-containing protein [Rhizophagus irregularis DAOM 181602=DAOM 197198]|nr:kinase-like domain-containing protein [Rhizophagus irregularis DAOM 181602=DAOM 197198]